MFPSLVTGRVMRNTHFFDKAGNKRSGVKMNPKNHQNPSMHSDNVSPVQATPSQMETKSGAQNGQQPVRRTKHVRSTSREDGDIRRPSDSPRSHDTANPKVSGDSPLGHHGSVNSSDSTKGATRHSTKGATRQNMGPDRRIEHSPLHPHHQAKSGGKGSAMSSRLWERKGSNEHSNNLAPLTPGRPRLRSVTQGSETPDYSTAVPKFGDWDESDPKSADGFTHVFEKVKEEKLNGTTNVPVKAFQNSYAKGQKQHANEISKRCCCFPW